jgi:signal transduction histidine kinase
MILNLINDMMDLAKTENMKFDLNNKLFDLIKTIERSFDIMAFLAKEKNIKLVL